MPEPVDDTPPDGAESDALALMPVHPSQGEVIDALEASWHALHRFATEFDPAQWDVSTPLAGWTVRDVYAHVIGTEKMLAGAPLPEIDIGNRAHVHNDIGRTNEVWVASMAELSPADLLREFDEVTSERLKTLRALSPQEWAAPSWTPAGDATLGRWMHIRVYDCWVHEQDVRVALGLPGGLDGIAAELSLAEVAFALGYIVGKRGEAPDGARIEFRLGPVPSEQLLRVAVDGGRAKVVPQFVDSAPTSVISLPFDLFMRLTAGRRSAENALADGLIQVDGDTKTGERVARNLRFAV